MLFVFCSKVPRTQLITFVLFLFRWGEGEHRIQAASRRLFGRDAAVRSVTRRRRRRRLHFYLPTSKLSALQLREFLKLCEWFLGVQNCASFRLIFGSVDASWVSISPLICLRNLILLKWGKCLQKYVRGTFYTLTFSLNTSGQNNCVD